MIPAINQAICTFSKPMEKTAFGKLPREICSAIFSQLKRQDLTHLILTSQEIRQLTLSHAAEKTLQPFILFTHILKEAIPGLVPEDIEQCVSGVEQRLMTRIASVKQLDLLCKSESDFLNKIYASASVLWKLEELICAGIEKQSDKEVQVKLKKMQKNMHLNAKIEKARSILQHPLSYLPQNASERDLYEKNIEKQRIKLLVEDNQSEDALKLIQEKDFEKRIKGRLLLKVVFKRVEHNQLDDALKLAETMTDSRESALQRVYQVFAEKNRAQALEKMESTENPDDKKAAQGGIIDTLLKKGMVDEALRLALTMRGDKDKQLCSIAWECIWQNKYQLALEIINSTIESEGERYYCLSYIFNKMIYNHSCPIDVLALLDLCQILLNHKGDIFISQLCGALAARGERYRAINLLKTIQDEDIRKLAAIQISHYARPLQGSPQSPPAPAKEVR